MCHENILLEHRSYLGLFIEFIHYFFIEKILKLAFWDTHVQSNAQSLIPFFPRANLPVYLPFFRRIISCWTCIIKNTSVKTFFNQTFQKLGYDLILDFIRNKRYIHKSSIFLFFFSWLCITNRKCSHKVSSEFST